jgi:hypothetical protein
MKKEPIPQHIVTEFLGNIQLAGNQERQIYVSEQLASNTYSSMEDLIEVSREYAKNQRTYKKETQDMKESPFFKPYFKKQ